MGSASITSKSFEGRYFKFTVSQSGTSTSVNWTFEVLGGSSLYYTASPITLKINGTTVWSKSSITYWDAYAFPAAKGSTSGTYNVGGYGSVSIQLIGNPNWHAAETVSGTVTLDRPTYPVYYNTMGGSGTFNAQTKTYGINLGLHSHKPTKTGYTFQGWATSSTSSTVAYAAGATYTGNARLDLFAVWKADTYAVTYNANGGSGAPANQTKTYGVTLKLQTGVPTRTNYNFLGWGTSASATTVAYAPGANYTGNTRLDLYAIWELAYVKPRITNLLVDRCDSGGTPTEDGTYAVVAFNWATDRDVTSVKIEWKLASATSYPSGNSKTVSTSGTSGTVNTVVGSGSLSADNTYTIRVTVTDSIDSSDETRTLSSMEFTLDLLAGGKGAAFGKAAELEDTLEVDWTTKFNGPLIATDIDLAISDAEYRELADLLNGIDEDYVTPDYGVAADYVVGRGEDGVFAWEKWNSGKMVLNIREKRYFQFNIANWNYYRPSSACVYYYPIYFTEPPFIKTLDGKSDMAGFVDLYCVGLHEDNFQFWVNMSSAVNTNVELFICLEGKWK